MKHPDARLPPLKKQKCQSIRSDLRLRSDGCSKRSTQITCPACPSQVSEVGLPVDTSHGGCSGKASLLGSSLSLGGPHFPLVRTPSALPECPWPRGPCSARGPRRRVLSRSLGSGQLSENSLERHHLESVVCSRHAHPVNESSLCRKVPCQALRGFGSFCVLQIRIRVFRKG